MSTPLPPWQPPPTGWTPTGATGTSSVAVAAVGIFVWVLKVTLNVTVPPDVIVYTAIVTAFFGAYLHPAGRK